MVYIPEPYPGDPRRPVPRPVPPRPPVRTPPWRPRPPRNFWDEKFVSPPLTRLIGRVAPYAAIFVPDEIGPEPNAWEVWPGMPLLDDWVPPGHDLPKERLVFPVPGDVVSPSLAPDLVPPIVRRGKIARVRVPLPGPVARYEYNEELVVSSPVRWAPGDPIYVEDDPPGLPYEKIIVPRVSMTPRIVQVDRTPTFELRARLGLEPAFVKRHNEAKTRSKRMYLAFNRFLDRVWGPLSEAMDLWEALSWNVYVEMADGRRRYLAQMTADEVWEARGALELDIDGLILDVLVMEASDRLIAKLSRTGAPVEAFVQARTRWSKLSQKGWSDVSL